jgi:SAM-dependent methyltransferase
MSAPPRIFTPEYYERMRGLEEDGWWNAGMRDMAARFLGQARLPDRGLLLDVGCGSGQTIRWLLGLLPGWKAAGIDVALDGLRAAPAQGATAVVAGSALDIPLADGSADLVVTLDVIQHLPLEGGDVRALREMRRVLRQDGTLFVRTNAQAFPVTPDDPEHNFHKYRVPELEGKLHEAGFRVDRLSRVNALLGLAEIPRELRADREQASSYHGILAQPRGSGGLGGRLKRSWLGVEGRAAAVGLRLPLGRTILALCTAR